MQGVLQARWEEARKISPLAVRQPSIPPFSLPKEANLSEKKDLSWKQLFMLLPIPISFVGAALGASKWGLPMLNCIYAGLLVGAALTLWLIFRDERKQK